MKKMIYRTLPHGREKISIIGIGSSSIQESSVKKIEETVEYALERGVNYFDMASSEAKPFAPYGKVFKEQRDKVYLQIHFGAEYETGTYGWTTNLNKIKKSIDWQLKALQTDYIDFGFIHCLDAVGDLHTAEKNGIIKYIEDLKSQGVVKHIGLSSHTPSTTNKVLDMNIIDMLMFSINPGYDYSKGDFARGNVEERMALYRRCEKEGVGISVMKPFSGGQMLDAKTSPFGEALTEYQCLQYALDKPGVLTVLPGIRGQKDLDKILGFLEATAKEKDYAIIGNFTPSEASGKCVYCNHCKPCPQKLDIGLINKYYDLAKAGDALAVSHYEKLTKKASDCVQCGHCNNRCPFHVDQMARMKTIAKYFKK